MQPEQKITYMAKGKSYKASIYVSTINQLSAGLKEPRIHPSQQWETFVFYTEKDEPFSPPLFENLPPYQEFGPVFCSNHLLGSDRNLQHEYAVNQLRRRGYRIVRERDNLKEWDKRLQEIPSLDFTLEELRKLKFYRWLREQRKLS